MSTGTIELLVFGFVAIVTGLFFLVSLVRELAPDERRRWLLGIGLGAGVIAFSLKITLILVFSAFSQPILELFTAREHGNRGINEAAIEDIRSEPEIIKTGYTWETLSESAPFPQDNPPSPEKIALGKTLFFDTRLSADNSLSCASCHELSNEKGGSDGLTASIGIRGQQGSRNAPTVLNAAFQRVLFWDGRAASLEEQAKGPLLNPIEMGMPSAEKVEERVKSIPKYREAFASIFNQEPSVTMENIAKAIAAYERTLITPDSPYDRYVKGDSTALSEKQIRGMALFESTGCVSCHSGPNFSGASVYGENAAYRIFPAIPNTEYERRYHLSEDLGVAKTTPDSERGIWRIPSLRNASRTRPYFHNGSVKSLEEAVRIMARVQLGITLSNNTVDDKSVYWFGADRRISVSTDQALSDIEIGEIVEFLESLNGELPEL